MNSMGTDPCHNFKQPTGPSTSAEEDCCQIQVSSRGRPLTSSIPETPSVNVMPLKPPVDLFGILEGLSMQQDLDWSSLQAQLPVQGMLTSIQQYRISVSWTFSASYQLQGMLILQRQHWISISLTSTGCQLQGMLIPIQEQRISSDWPSVAAASCREFLP